MLWYIHFFLFTFVFRHEKHSYLLEASSNYVLRAYIDGIKLLIYSSEVLPPDSQCQWFYSLFPFIQEKQWPVLLSHYIWWFFPNLNALETWKLEKISNVLCTFSKILISIMVTGIDGENYLWGLFVRSKGKSDPRQFSLTTTWPFHFPAHGSVQQRKGTWPNFKLCCSWKIWSMLLSCSSGCCTLVTFSLPGWFVFLHPSFFIICLPSWLEYS